MRRKAFTLIELLVVVAIITMLLALLMPSMSRAVFTSRVAVCASNMHQAMVALDDYAVDSYRFFPRQDVPASTGDNPWDISMKTLDAFAQHGYTPAMWYCPFSVPSWAGQVNKLTLAQLLQQISYNQAGAWGTFPLCYWVPRYDASHHIIPVYGDSNGANTLDNWPTGLTHRRLGSRPLISDALLTSPTYFPINNQNHPDLGSGGHPFNGVVLSINGGYGDGHVETHSVPHDVNYIPNPRWANSQVWY